MKTKMTKHHRKPRSRGGTNDKGNISYVPENKHRAYHLIFGDASPGTIAKILNDTWIDPRFKLIVIEKEMPDPNQLSLFPNKKPPH